MQRAVLFLSFASMFFWTLGNGLKFDNSALASSTKTGPPKVLLAVQDLFYCPYHPEKPYDAPGKCPKCGRTLQSGKPGQEPNQPQERDHEQHHEGEAQKLDESR